MAALEVEYRPDGHALHAEEPLEAYCPAAHVAQVNWPLRLCARPAGHWRHTVDPAKLYLPERHSAHTVEPSMLDLPAWQVSQVWYPSALWYLPDAQCLHETRPVWSANWPIAQDLHSIPVDSWYFPMEQLVHS